MEKSDSASQEGKKPVAVDLINSQEDTWQARKDQDGSGYIKLNERCTGRYISY